MRQTALILALIIGACSPQNASDHSVQVASDLREFIVISGLLQTGQHELALDRFAMLGIRADDDSLDRFERLEDRESIALSGSESPADEPVGTELQPYDPFLDYTLFGLGGTALERGDNANFDLIIALLQRRREVIDEVASFGNCQGHLLADVLIELRDEALTSDEIFSRWQSGVAENEACNHGGSGGLLVFWPLFDINYAPVIQTRILERLQQSGMDVRTYGEGNLCINLSFADGLEEALADQAFLADTSLGALRAHLARCAENDLNELIRAHWNGQSGPDLDALVSQNILPADLANFLAEASIGEFDTVCQQGSANEEPNCRRQVLRLIHEPTSDRWGIDVKDGFGSHSLTIGRFGSDYRILSRTFTPGYL